MSQWRRDTGCIRRSTVPALFNPTATTSTSWPRHCSPSTRHRRRRRAPASSSAGTTPTTASCRRPTQLHDGNPLRQGWQAGRPPSACARCRPRRTCASGCSCACNAWLRGRAFELHAGHAALPAQIDVAVCPITRAAADARQRQPAATPRSTACCNDAGYAAGNLAVMSTRANHAKAELGCRDALAFVQQLEAVPAWHARRPDAAAVGAPGGADVASSRRCRTPRRPACRCWCCRRTGCACSTRCRRCRRWSRASWASRRGASACVCWPTPCPARRSRRLQPAAECAAAAAHRSRPRHDAAAMKRAGRCLGPTRWSTAAGSVLRCSSTSRKSNRCCVIAPAAAWPAAIGCCTSGYRQPRAGHWKRAAM